MLYTDQTRELRQDGRNSRTISLASLREQTGTAAGVRHCAASLAWRSAAVSVAAQAVKCMSGPHLFQYNQEDRT